MGKAAWLVDVGYVVKASEGRFKLDYLAAERLVGQRCGPTSAFLFNGYDMAYGIPAGLQAFYDTMTRHGLEVRLHPMQSGPPGTNRQRRVDVDLSAHIVWQASRPETATVVLTAGDQDFVPAVELVRQQFGRQVVLFTYDAMVHGDLKRVADERWLFEDDEALLARR